MMAQQNSQYLLKQLGKIMGGAEVKFEYLTILTQLQDLSELVCNFSTVESMLSIPAVEEMMKVRAAYTIGQAALKFTSEKGDEKTKWNEKYQIDFIKVSRMFTYYDMMRCSIKQIAQFKDPKLQYYCQYITMLFAVNDLIKDPVALFESGYFKPKDFALLKKA